MIQWSEMTDYISNRRYEKLFTTCVYGKLRNYQHNRIECSTINVGVSRVKMTVVEDL